MTIQTLQVGPIMTNCYLLCDEDAKVCALIDPGDDAARVEKLVEQSGCALRYILLTHGHFDHMMGIDKFLKEFQVPVYVHEDDSDIMTDPKLNLSATYTAGYTFANAQTVHDGQILKAAGYEFQVIHTPGHTRGGCCYYVKEENVLFSGDTLFQRSIGRSDFPNSSTADLVRSVREKLFVLPEDTFVYPGHMGETTIGYEKKNNPYV